MEVRSRAFQDRLGVALVCAAYAAVSAFLAWRLPLWTDEVYTLHTTSEGPLEAARRALSFELQPPLYFVLEALWRAVWSGPLEARVPSILFGLATVVVGAALAHRLMPGIRTPWAALLIATNPFIVWAGSEARCYALVALLGASICLVFVRVHLEGRSRERPLLIVLAILALYTQYYLGFLLAAAGASLLLLRKYREAGRYALEMGVVLLFFVPQIEIMLHQANAHSNALPTQPVSIRSFLFETETSIAEYSLPIQWLWEEGDARTRVLRWGLRVAVGAGLLGVFWRRRKEKEGAPALALFAVLTVVSYLTGALLTRLAGEAWFFRYWAGFAIPAILLPIALVYEVRLRVVTVLALVVLLVGNVVASVIDQKPLSKTEDNRRVGQTLERLERDNEPILVTPADRVLSLVYYYRGRNRLVPVPREPSMESYRRADIFAQSPTEFWEALHRAGDPKAVWVLTGDRVLRRLAEESLAEQWQQDLRLEFAGETSLAHFVQLVPRRDFAAPQ
jgi:hypothetical protein